MALQATGLVCSAACGTDLVALAVARELAASGLLRMRRRIVLPSSPDTFRTTSVADRPGDWVPDYDALVQDSARGGDLLVLPGLPPGDDAYLAANQAILDEALRLAGGPAVSNVRAIVVWNGPRATGPDATAAFRDAALRMSIAVEEIPTL